MAAAMSPPDLQPLHKQPPPKWPPIGNFWVWRPKMINQVLCNLLQWWLQRQVRCSTLNQWWVSEFMSTENSRSKAIFSISRNFISLPFYVVNSRLRAIHMSSAIFRDITLNWKEVNENSVAFFQVKSTKVETRNLPHQDLLKTVNLSGLCYLKELRKTGGIPSLTPTS